VKLQYWNLTDNAAGLAFSNVNKGAFTTLERYGSGGDHHRVQQGSSFRGLTFFSEGYSNFSDKLSVKGSFLLTKDKEYDRGWSDVINTYNSNPYIFGSSVRGDYDKIQFDLKLKLYTANIGRLNFGLGFDYTVADISRQRDPRTRTYFIDYSLTPSFVFSLSNKSKVGFNAFYRFQKERMPSISTVQTDPNLQYYNFFGLQNVNGRIGGYMAFQRQFVSDFAGLALQYNFEAPQLKFLASASIGKQWQQTLGRQFQSPGSFDANYIDLFGSLMLTGEKFLHNLVAKGAFKDGGANEFRQSFFSERDPETGVVTEFWVTDYIYKNRFVVNTTDVSLTWNSFALRDNQKEYKWRLGAEFSYNAFSNVFYLPKSEFEIGRVFGGVSGSFFIFNDNRRSLQFEGLARVGSNTRANLDLSFQNVVSENVIEPDLAYFLKNTIELDGSLRFTFPLSFLRSGMASGYIRIYGGNVFATDSFNWASFGLAVGLLTL
jgi:hypothetical protein